MTINVNGNIISSTGFTTSSEIANTPSVVTDSIVLWLDAGNNASYTNSSTYYDCGYGCQYYGSDPGCTNCNTQWKDMSGYGNDATLNGATATYSNIGGYMLYNGSSDYASFSSNTTFKASGGWTVESWVNLTSVVGGNLYNFIGIEPYVNNADFWCVYQSKLALWNISPGYWRYGSTTILANTWYQATIVCDNAGTGYQFYLNGVAEGGDHVGNVWNATYAPLRLRYVGQGGATLGGRFFYGKYPIIRIYTKALSANEILQNFNAGRQRFGI